MIDCQGCGRSFEPKRSAKACSPRCYKRVSRAGLKSRPAEVPEPELRAEVPIGLVASTLVELVRAGRENSAAGQSALLLAYRLEHAHTDTGSSMAALAKQHAERLEAALKGVAEASQLDQLKARRDAKRVG